MIKGVLGGSLLISVLVKVNVDGSLFVSMVVKGVLAVVETVPVVIVVIKVVIAILESSLLIIVPREIEVLSVAIKDNMILLVVVAVGGSLIEG